MNFLSDTNPTNDFFEYLDPQILEDDEFFLNKNIL